ncbi:glycosyl transferase [Enterococcus florum]|uniref:Glycosyl transferase n=1 Tax=Enterococcus florum TaxID=2480627 RepID=A0A4P5PAK3_9ENTE|nr:glycosyltransferase [Enterococcus florum]GCF95135.1 glycosyl transferase [Enterococcus florum]
MEALENRMNQMKKKKIVMVLPSLRVGGAEKLFVNIANRLDKKKYDVILIVFEKKGALRKIVNKEVTIQTLCYRSKIKKITNLILTICRIKPDITFSTVFNANTFCGIVNFFYKDCLYIGRETMVHSEVINNQNAITKFFVQAIYKYLISRLDIIIAQSEFMKSELNNLINRSDKKIYILSNPIDKQDIDYPIIENETKNLLSIGRLVPLKRTLLLLEIMKGLNSDYHLTIVGDGPEKSKVQNMIFKLNLQNRVTLCGELIEISDLYRKSDLLVVSSAYESYPNVIMEALSFGKRVVAFDVPGAIKEILTNPLRGKVVRNGDIATFRKTIEEITREDIDPERITETIENQSWKIYIEQLEKIFETRR